MRPLAILLALALAAAACGDPDEGGSVPGTSTTSTTSAPTTTSPPPGPPSSPSADGGVVAAGPAPWAEPPLAIDEVPAVLVSEWTAASNRDRCAALFPVDVDDGASVRAADFGSDAWAIAWDRSTGPGRSPGGEYCADCGRGAFGVAGTLDATAGNTSIWPNRIRWEDGSEAGYGDEGFSDPGSGAPHLMYLRVEGEGCLYNVWSFVGEDHLLGLVDRLRRVKGLDAGDAGSPPFQDSIENMGAPSWTGEDPLPASEVAVEYLVEWGDDAGAPRSCPLLVYDGLGEELVDARIRQATSFGEMLVAWDRPEGPGHDAAGEPCEDCGRGVVGLGTFQSLGESRHPVTHRWDDGSVGSAYDGLYGAEMHLRPAGFDCTYWLWSHLGEDHLEQLLARLRLVQGHP